jgi:hypothetical protein
VAPPSSPQALALSLAAALLVALRPSALPVAPSLWLVLVIAGGGCTSHRDGPERGPGGCTPASACLKLHGPIGNSNNSRHRPLALGLTLGRMACIAAGAARARSAANGVRRHA